MKVGLVDVDGVHGFPNLALMKIARWHMDRGDSVEMALPMFEEYDRIYASKVFTFSEEPNWNAYRAGELLKGGTGYNIEGMLPMEIEAVGNPCYDIYPRCDFSLQFYSRGCIRRCPFCVVSRKEGFIRPVEPMALNPRGQYIEVMDNNFFANPEWKSAVEDLMRIGQPVKLRGVDARIMTEEHAYWINRLKLKQGICIAWDSPKVDMRPKLRELIKWLKPYKLVCYMLIGYDSTREEDYQRARYLKELGIRAFAMPYRDYDNKRKPTQFEKDFANWVNKRECFVATDFFDFSPRIGVLGKDYFSDEFIGRWRAKEEAVEDGVFRLT